MSVSLTETLVLTRAIVRKSIVLRMRYAFNTATNVVTVYAFFVSLVFFGRYIAPKAITDSLSSVIVGFFLLLVATVAYSTISWELLHDAQRGTFEQLFMSPLGFGRVVLITSGMNVVTSLGYGAVLLALVSLTANGTLVIYPLTVILIGLLALGSVVGIGFTLGGLALVSERIENVFQIVQLSFVVFVSIPVENSLELKLLPLSLGGYLLQQSMAAGVPLWELPVFDLGLLVVKSIAYIAAGYVVFQYAGRVARKRGRPGLY